MSDVVYQSRVKIQRLGGPIRRATVPGEEHPVMFGTHGAIAAHYGVDPEAFPSHATTIDYVVAAAAG